MIYIKDKHNCCGCEACVQRCPKHCISMIEDNEGFLYPKVDISLCINCGLCEKVCPEINILQEKEPLKVFGAKHNDNNIVLNSSSGGIFTFLANKILDDGGVVFGARFDENWNVIHDYTETKEGLAVFRNSKYVQSRIGKNFKIAKQFLEKGKKVLFTGTPCQIKALNLYLKKNYENLLTVDVVCHGVPSPSVWSMYLNAKMNKLQKNIYDIRYINFRDKKYGWKDFSLTIKYCNSCIIERHFENKYMKLFLNNLILRPSCYSCLSKKGQSKSDITIADFWGVENILNKNYDNDGYSLVFINTIKGEEIFKISDLIEYYTVSYSLIECYNGGISPNISIPRRRKMFFENFSKATKDNILSIIDNALQIPLGLRIRYKIIKIIKYLLKK